MEPTNNGENISPQTSNPGGKPISLYTFAGVNVPAATEKVHEEFITYGANNLFPQALIDAWLESPIHSALVNGITQMIAGGGINFEPTILELEIWTRKVNKNGESLADLIYKTAFDLYLHGYFGWQVIYNQQRTAIVEVYHVPAETIRSGKADSQGVVHEYYISWDWSQYRKKKFKPKRIAAFDPTDRSEGTQLMFVKQYRPSQYYYSTPAYIGALNWILLDNRVGEFHLNNIENGFFPSSIIQFYNGEPPQEQKRQIELGFMQKFTGKSQAKIVFVYNNNLEEKVSFDTYEPANIDRRFRDLMPEIARMIMIGNRVTSPLLFGIRDSSGLGNNAEELQSASVLMNKTVIIPYQLMIVQAMSVILRLNGWTTEMIIETLQPAQFLEGDTADATAGDEGQEEFKGAKQDKRQVIPDNMIRPVLDHLASIGETAGDLEKQGYVLVMEEDRLTAEGIRLKLNPEKFQQIPQPQTEADSDLDSGLYKIRYAYRVGVGMKPIIDTTRDFCREVLGLNYIYRKEDIDQMSDNQANPEFGSYNIFDFKGSYGCRHRWQRLVFFRKRNAAGQFLPDEGLMNDKVVPSTQAPADVIAGAKDEDKEATTLNKNL